MRRCTRRGCTSTANAFPKLSFRDAAGNQSSAMMRLAVCAEHQEPDVRIYLAGGEEVCKVALDRHEEHYGLRPFLGDTRLSYVPFESVEGATYLGILEEQDNTKKVLREIAGMPRVIEVEEVSREEYERLLKEGNRNRS